MSERGAFRLIPSMTDVSEIWRNVFLVGIFFFN